MRYIIRAGKHRSCFRVRPCFGTKRMDRTVMFDSSASYHFGDEDDDAINKLYGFSSGLHHRNSARFGWRYNPEKKAVDIFAYVYRDGKRVKPWDEHTYVCTVGFYREVRMSITMADGSYAFAVTDRNTTWSTTLKTGKRMSKLGYYLYPYFGGEKTAPHDVIIDIY